MTRLIAPQTSAVTASEDTQFQVSQGRAMTISATALATTEEVDITYSGDGTSFTTATDDSGNAIVLTASIGQILLRGVGTYRIAKDATAAECGVNVVG